METITVYVGTEHHMRDGRTQEDTRPLEFVGELLAKQTSFGYHREQISDTRGTTETLYRAEDGRLLVHIHEWSKWQGEADRYDIFQVTETDLQPAGRFEALGREAGYGRPLTLDEALND